MSFDVTFEVEHTYNLNGVENTLIATVQLIGYPNGSWSIYDLRGELIEDPADRCIVWDLSQNPHLTKALTKWLEQNREFCERADDKVMEEFYDHV